MYLSDIYTIAVNLAGLPGISIPAGFVDDLPVGMQLIGNYFAEAKLLNVAHQISTSRLIGIKKYRRVLIYDGISNHQWQWETVIIGLRSSRSIIHKIKIFSGASTAYGAEPNTQACAIDLGFTRCFTRFKCRSREYGH